MNKILLLEDDVSLIDGLVYSLKKNGFDIEVVRTVREAFQYELNQYDLLILDVTLPDGTGFDVCEKVRKENQQIPIIFLTASDEEVSIIRGLDSGGDDYVTKPFKLGELCSRICALLRRARVSDGENGSTIACGDISIDLLGSRVSLKGKNLDLTSAEYRLLCLMIRNANRIVTREVILNELWDATGNFVDDNTLSVYVRRLREKVETEPSHPEHLITVRGFGYHSFLIIYSLLLLIAGFSLGMSQIHHVKSLYRTHDEAMASSLLEQGVSRGVIAAAICRKITKALFSRFFLQWNSLPRCYSPRVKQSIKQRSF